MTAETERKLEERRRKKQDDNVTSDEMREMGKEIKKMLKQDKKKYILGAISEEIDVRDEENKNNFPHQEEKDHTQSSPVSHALVPANTFAQNKIIKDDKFIYKAALEGDDPYMSILLPASAVSGGTVTPRRDEPWIELGCQVLSAKIVNGVDFLEADKENITS